MYSAYAAATTWVAAFGVDRIEAMVRPNATELKVQLSRVAGCSVLTPLDPMRSTGIVAFRLANLSGTDLVTRLWDEARIVCRAAFGGTAVRLSVAWFTTPAEIELAVRTIRRLAT
jgi:selenocysteine lyase/cysteine desulfurase